MKTKVKVEWISCNNRYSHLSNLIELVAGSCSIFDTELIVCAANTLDPSMLMDSVVKSSVSKMKQYVTGRPIKLIKKKKFIQCEGSCTQLTSLDS